MEQFEKPAPYEAEREPRLLNLSNLRNSELHERLDSDTNELFTGGRSVDDYCFLPGYAGEVFAAEQTDGSPEEIQAALDAAGIPANRYVGYGTGNLNVGFTKAVAVEIARLSKRYGMGDDVKLYIPTAVSYDY